MAMGKRCRHAAVQRRTETGVHRLTGPAELRESTPSSRSAGKVGLTRQHAARTSARILLFSTMVASTAGTAFGAGQAATQINTSQTTQDVQRALGDERDLRPVEVSVEGSEVTLRGRVPTLWAKSEAIRKTLEVDGVETVVSELGDSSRRG